MLKSRTLTASVAAPPAVVYEFTSDPRNLPQWASGLCQSVERAGGKWVIHCRDGATATIEFAAKNTLGVLDHTVTLEPDVTVYVPMRVVANGPDSEILFTLFQLPGMDDQQFAHDVQLVENDLHALKRLFESAHGPRT